MAQILYLFDYFLFELIAVKFFHQKVINLIFHIHPANNYLIFQAFNHSDC
jgi:hypothetical protein